jgi:dTDP-4-amino-4,6-dideoxygalactose transaminase
MGAERLARRDVYLPSGMALTEAQIDTVAAAVREILHASPTGPF